MSSLLIFVELVNYNSLSTVAPYNSKIVFFTGLGKIRSYSPRSYSSQVWAKYHPIRFKTVTYIYDWPKWWYTRESYSAQMLSMTLLFDEFDKIVIIILFWIIYLRIEWRPVCVHAAWTRLVTRQIYEARQFNSLNTRTDSRSNMSLSSCLLFTLMKQHLDMCTYKVETKQRRQWLASFDIAIHKR